MIFVLGIGTTEKEIGSGIVPKVFFKNQNLYADVAEGVTILDAARSVGVVVESPCNSIGTCGKCKVKIGLDSMSKIVYHDGLHKVSDEELRDGIVLACQSEVIGDITVEVESTAKQNSSLKILNEGVTFQYEISPYITKKCAGASTEVYGDDALLGIEDGDTTGEIYGISIDIGTTTVVCSLIDMVTGAEISSTSALNPQSLHAQDVLTRIKLASEPEGLALMYGGIVKEFNRMIGVICKDTGISPARIYEVIYSGNTTMIHLAGNRNPKSLGKYPYTPVLRGGCYDSAAEHNLNISPFGLIYYPPIISSYVGPDITSGVLSTTLKQRKGTVLFIDIGTNGEMVISRDGSLSATSTAAGPAFEGMNITFGMRAGVGAIEYFEILDDGEIELRTIGGTKPVGICGSGLFDIVGELVRVGIVTKTGRFLKPAKLDDGNKLKPRLKDYEGKPAFEIADGVFITISDIRQVQLAKGAVRSGVEALMTSQNVRVEDVDSVLIAGSFGFHLRAKSLVNLALLPVEFGDKIDFVGNTSKTGGIAFLLNSGLRDAMSKLVSEILCIELSTVEGYNDLFVGCLNF
ncbi:MAG: ASKHA domain-containing protein [Oscillospiraceae bacterium]